MDEIEIIKFQVATAVSSLQSNILRYYDALHELKRISQLLINVTQRDNFEIEKWFKEEGFDICEDGFFQSIPSLRKHRDGTLSHDTISYSCHPEIRFDEEACFHMYCHRDIGTYLSDIRSKLSGAAWIYFQSLSNIALQYPFIDQSAAITPDFDWSTYHTWISVSPDNNPEREIQWTMPSIDYAGEGLILSASIPVYMEDIFHGLWSIDLPMDALYHSYINETHILEQINFITDYRGNIIIHPDIKTTIDKEKGSISQQNIKCIGEGFAKLDLMELISQKYGQQEVLLENDREYELFFRIIPEIHWIYFSIFPKDRMIDIINSKIKSALDKVKGGDYSYRLKSFPEALSLNDMENSFNDMAEAIDIQRQQIQDAHEKILQSEKLSVVGLLAGGVAHDFNNILSGILGYAEMAKNESQEDSVQRDYLDQVILAGNRAKELVYGILAFSRQTKSEQKTLQLVTIVNETIKLLRSSIPATITIEQRIDETSGFIKADATEIHQVIMNLCTNAYHAMEDHGGILTICLSTTELTEIDLVDEPSLTPGSYVQLSIEDTGTGMDATTCQQIFEPYFTTKEIGKGTGMGLAIVHGIVENHGGLVRVKSTLEKGTIFTVFFPEIQCVPQRKAKTMLTLPVGNENILLVDDEKLLADVGRDLLEGLGYSVTASTSSLKALELIKSKPGQFDLVITDQTMPEMTGSELAEEILGIYPDMPIILCTGYSGVMPKEKALALGIKKYVMKPIVKKEFAPLIRTVLDEKKDKTETI